MSLLSRARARYAEADLAPRGDEWRGFAGGTRWMARALGRAIDAQTARRGARLALVKYGAAILGGLALGAIAARLHPLLAPVGFTFGFYAVEVQGVFLLPALVAGAPNPLAHSRKLVEKSGGTLAAMAKVMPIAGWMLFGGLTHGSPVRAWCEGATAVVVWFEDL